MAEMTVNFQLTVSRKECSSETLAFSFIKLSVDPKHFNNFAQGFKARYNSWVTNPTVTHLGRLTKYIPTEGWSGCHSVDLVAQTGSLHK